MPRSLNRATIIGHVGKDPEVRSTQTGTRIASLSVATGESWRDKNTGEKMERTEWHRITVFAEHSVDFVDKYVRKGDFIMVEGSIETRKWTDRDNKERYTTEIVVRPYGGMVNSLEKSTNSGGGGGDYAGEYAGGDGGRGNGGTGRLRERAGATRGGQAADAYYQHGNDGRPLSGAGSDLDDEIPF